MTDRVALLAADRSARQLAQTEFERPLVLEAGAGTGKTTTLVARLLAWTLGPGWERAAARLAARAAVAGDPEREIDDERIAAEVLSGVVAITFTEAAAAEMAHRAARDLAEVAKSFGRVPGWLEAAALPPEAERVRRAWALLATLDQLNVSTIHAFCRRLLAEHPLEAGVHPQLTVDADGRLLDEAVQEAVEGAMRSGYGEPGDPHLLTLAARGLGPRELVEALLVLAREGLPASALLADPLTGAGAAALSRGLLDAARELKSLLPARFKGRAPNAEKVAAAVHQLAGCFAGVEAAGLEALSPKCAELLTENLVNHLGNWEKGSFNQAEDTAFADRAEAVAAASGRLRRAARFLAGFDAELLTAARGALAPLLATVETAMRTRGAATFQSLLSGAARLLSNHPGVRREVRGRIDQLLVDEFQDTDRQQCALLAALALPDPSAPDAPLPGLFLVGDPKQSIYGWRSADLSAYSGFVDRVSEAGGEVLPLVENFRSVPGILAEVEEAVAPVMRERAGLQPAFQPLVACAKLDEEEGFAAAGRRPVEHWVLWRPPNEVNSANATDAPGLGKTPLVVAAELEAEAVARDIAELHEREGVAWNSFGILLRGFGSVEVVLEALRARRIPFAVGRDRQYYRRREIIEASALVCTVLDPGDHLALLTWLRSASVGVPDAALIPLWSRGFPRLASELDGSADSSQTAEALQRISALVREAALATPRDVPGIAEIAGWEASLEAAMAALAAMRRSFATDAADLFVEKLRRLSFIEPTEAARYLGPYRLANLDRFFRRLLEAFEEEGDAGALLRVLRRSITEGLDAEEARPDGGEAAVSVLTIHGAKGLDFEHVYLLQTHRQPPADNETGTAVGQVGSSSTEPGESRWEVRLFGAPTPGFAEVEAERAAVEAAERVRTLYVALTRAKVRLVISGLWNEREANPDNAAADPGNLAERARSHLHLLTARAGRPDLAALWSELESAEPQESSWIDGDGVLWRFPGLDAAAARAEASPKARTAGVAPPYGTAVEVAAAVRDLGERRRQASARQARRISAPASEEAHERLRQLQAERNESAAESPEAVLVADAANASADIENRRNAAMAAGTAVHRALETWDLAAEVAAERARQIENLSGTLATLVGIDPEARHAAEVRARGLLEAFAAGPLIERLRTLSPNILARELPVLLPAPANLELETGPVGFISGAIDLLYREEGLESGGFVVVDYKTDDIQSEGELNARAAAYAPQGAHYARAIRDALGLAEPPRFELWFLSTGSVVRLDP
ncbi:MAG TPA: UvrD-helicase domain-containing protein [Thermoanaerobaculia bacterium]|nr:UvrD-helicase domain-containing protein [Thermoanaerobaculia bacterium]